MARISRPPIQQDGLLRCLYDLWPQLVLILTTSCFLAVFMVTQSSASNANGDFFCNANGAPSYFATREGFYEPFWDPKLFFNVNVPFGHLSYTSAKIIDACWDLAFARGGQALAGLLSYRVIRRSLALVMEQSPVAIPLATAICCENGKLTLLGRTLHSFWCGSRQTRLRWKSQPLSVDIRLAAWILVCIYVLSFSTLASVMTGYQARFTGYFDANGVGWETMRPIESLARKDIIVHDGHRVGFQEGYWLSWNSSAADQDSTYTAFRECKERGHS